MNKAVMGMFLLFSFMPEAAAQNATLDIRDVRPPVALPGNYFWLIMLAALIILVLSFWGIRKLLQHLKSRAKAILEPVVLPWDRALSLLAQLAIDNLPGQGRIKEFYSRLSDIVRHYVEDRFLIRAPEMTTEEFLLSLRNSRILDQKQKEFLQEFLNQCDMVKFAKHKTTITEMEESLSLAIELINQTRDVAGQLKTTKRA